MKLRSGLKLSMKYEDARDQQHPPHRDQVGGVRELAAQAGHAWKAIAPLRPRRRYCHAAVAPGSSVGRSAPRRAPSSRRAARGRPSPRSPSATRRATTSPRSASTTTRPEPRNCSSGSPSHGTLPRLPDDLAVEGHAPAPRADRGRPGPASARPAAAPRRQRSATARPRPRQRTKGASGAPSALVGEAARAAGGAPARRAGRPRRPAARPGGRAPRARPAGADTSSGPPPGRSSGACSQPGSRRAVAKPVSDRGRDARLRRRRSAPRRAGGEALHARHARACRAVGCSSSAASSGCPARRKAAAARRGRRGGA